MRCLIKEPLLCAALLCVLSSTARAQEPASEEPPPPTRTVRAVSNFVAVTDEMLQAPSPEDWPFYRRNYQAWGYSPLDQINKSNVRNLQLVWARGMEPGINQITPLVYDGVMYLGNPGDVIQAIDATNGDLFSGSTATRYRRWSRSAAPTASASAPSRSMATTSTS